MRYYETAQYKKRFAPNEVKGRGPSHGHILCVFVHFDQIFAFVNDIIKVPIAVEKQL